MSGNRTKHIESDQIILELINKGGKARKEGVTQLYHQYAPLLRRWYLKRNRMKATNDAENFIHDVFEKVLRKINTYRGESQFSAWLWSIARNAEIDAYRRSARRPEGGETTEIESEVNYNQVAHPHASIKDTASSHDSLEDCVHKAFEIFALSNHINEERADTLAKKELFGWRIKDLASYIERTEGATREYISQCRKHIRPFMEPCMDYFSS